MAIIQVCGRQYSVSRPRPDRFVLSRDGVEIPVRPSPRGDGTWFAERVLLAVTFAIDAFGALTIHRTR